MVNIKLKYLNEGYMVFFFFLLLFIGCATIWDNRLNHEYPYGYMASDCFQHQAKSQAIKEMGSYKYEPFYSAAGFNDTLGFYPPLFHELSVMFSYASGMETYDSPYFLAYFFMGLIAILFYILISYHSKAIAIISLPVAILLFHEKPYWGMVTGHWPGITGQLFVMAVFWALLHVSLDRSYIFLGILFAAVFMTHPSEVLIVALFVAVYYGSALLLRKMDLPIIEVIKRFIIAGIIAFVLVSYFFVIFAGVWGSSFVGDFKSQPADVEGPAMAFSDFGVLAVLIIVGIVFFVLSEAKKLPIGLMISLFMLILGYGNMIGFVHYTSQLRFLWPIYLSALVGLGIYGVIRLFVRQYNQLLSFGVAAILSVLLLGLISVPYFPHYSQVKGPGLMDPYHWNAFSWIKDNTPIESRVYFFHGDVFSQNAMLRNIHRVHIQVGTKTLVEAMNNGTVLRDYYSRLMGDSHGVMYAYRKSFFSFGKHYDEYGDNYFKQNWDLCQMDYYFFDKVSQQPVLTKYNMLIRQTLLEKDYIKEVYSNEVVSILKNSKPGEDCLPKEGVKFATA